MVPKLYSTASHNQVIDRTSMMTKLMEAIKSARTRSRHARKNSLVDAAIADSL